MKTQDEIVIDMKKFNIRKQIKPDSKIAIFGKPGSGKSSLILAIMKLFSDKFPVVSIFSGTELEDPFFKGTVPDSEISYEFSESRMADIIMRQRLLKRGGHPNPWALTIIDDCTDDPKVFESKLFKNIFKMGRHYAHLIVFAFQEALDLPKKMRSNLDYIFIFKEGLPKARETLYKNYGAYLKLDQFTQLLDQCTDQYKCLVIDNRNTGTRPEDVYYWYKAQYLEPDQVRVGSEQYWDECKKHSGNDNDGEDDMF